MKTKSKKIRTEKPCETSESILDNTLLGMHKNQGVRMENSHLILESIPTKSQEFPEVRDIVGETLKTSPTTKTKQANPKKETKAQKISTLKTTLASNKKAAIQALLTLNRLQTESERSLGVALKSNGVGFTGYDAPILSSMALQLSKRGNLSPKQMAVVHRLIPRYATQLLKLQGKI
jgi:hypothetical protein